jgi:hypothetical protein
MPTYSAYAGKSAKSPLELFSLVVHGIVPAHEGLGASFPRQ